MKKAEDLALIFTLMYLRKYQRHAHLHVVAEANNSAIHVLLAAEVHGFRLNVQQLDLMRRQEPAKVLEIKGQRLK